MSPQRVLLRTTLTRTQFNVLEKLEYLKFADELVLLSQKITCARMKLEALQEQAARDGLKVNASKSKEMRIRALAPANGGDIMCRRKALEEVTVFTYLCSIVTTTGGTEEDVEPRCRKAQVAFSMLRPVWRSRYMSLWTKLRIFNSNMKSILLYGSETWRLTKTIVNQLQAFINLRHRYILGVVWPRKISNDDLWQRTKQDREKVTIRT